jgi:hypothetical protein
LAGLILGLILAVPTAIVLTLIVVIQGKPAEPVAPGVVDPLKGL